VPRQSKRKGKGRDDNGEMVVSAGDSGNSTGPSMPKTDGDGRPVPGSKSNKEKGVKGVRGWDEAKSKGGTVEGI